MAGIYNPSTLCASARWFTYTSVTNRHELLYILMVPVFTICVEVLRTYELLVKSNAALSAYRNYCYSNALISAKQAQTLQFVRENAYRNLLDGST